MYFFTLTLLKNEPPPPPFSPPPFSPPPPLDKARGLVERRGGVLDLENAPAMGEEERREEEEVEAGVEEMEERVWEGVKGVEEEEEEGRLDMVVL